MKFCKDCVHFQSYRQMPLQPECFAPQNDVKQDQVYGYKRFPEARSVRLNPTKCSEDGAWFEQKEVKRSWWSRMVSP